MALIPIKWTDGDGNIVLEACHMSENKKELKKLWFDRKVYMNWITIDPIKNQIIKCTCECPDFQIRRNRYTTCKHLNKVLNSLYNMGVKTLPGTTNENKVYDMEQGLWVSKTDSTLERRETIGV